MVAPVLARVWPSGFRHLRGPIGPPVLFLHGFGSESDETWRATGWLEATASSGLRALTVDLPGHGHSAMNWAGRFTVRELATLLDAALEREGVEHVSVVAHSMGSHLALELARLAPHRIDAICLIGVDDGNPLARKPLRPGTARSTDLDTSPQGALAVALALPGRSATGLLRCAQSMVSVPRPAHVAVPTMVLGGSRDRVTPDAAGFAIGVGAAFRVIEDAGHFGLLHSADAIAVSIEFIRVNASEVLS